MNVEVSEDCIGCGVCEGLCPDVFEIGDDGVAHALSEEVPADAEADVQSAVESCPVSAISVD